jgi:membrane protease YdiL (CAAX protease family)
MVFSETIILAALNGLYGGIANTPPAVLSNLMLVSPLFPLLLGAVAIARLKFAGVGIRRLIGFSRATIADDVLLGAAIGLFGLGTALGSLVLLAPYLEVPPFALMPVTAHIFFATVGAIVPGVCEELFFRGMLFKIAPPAPRWLLVAGSALAFALWHIGNPIYLAHTFALGLVLGAAVAARGRLAPAIIGHTLANALFGAWILAGLPLPTA